MISNAGWKLFAPWLQPPHPLCECAGAGPGDGLSDAARLYPVTNPQAQPPLPKPKGTSLLPCPGIALSAPVPSTSGPALPVPHLGHFQSAELRVSLQTQPCHPSVYLEKLRV